MTSTILHAEESDCDTGTYEGVDIAAYAREGDESFNDFLELLDRPGSEVMFVTGVENEPCRNVVWQIYDGSGSLVTEIESESADLGGDCYDGYYELTATFEVSTGGSSLQFEPINPEDDNDNPINDSFSFSDDRMFITHQRVDPPDNASDLTIGSSTLDIQVTDSISDRYCLGDRGSIELELTNTGACGNISGDIDLRLSQYAIFSDNEEQSLTHNINLKPGETKSITERFTIPDDAPPSSVVAENNDAEDYIFLEVDFSDTSGIDSYSGNVDVNRQDEVTFRSLTGNPSSAYEISAIDSEVSRGRISIDAEIQNSADCREEIVLEVTDLDADNSVYNESTTVSGNDTSSERIRLNVDDLGGEGEINLQFDLYRNADDYQTNPDTETVTVQGQVADLSISDTDHTSVVCGDNDNVDITVEVENDGEADGEARIEVRHSNDTSTEKTVRSGRTETFDVTTTPSDFNGGVSEIELFLQRVEDDIEAVDSTTISVDMGEASADVTSIDGSSGLVCVDQGSEVTNDISADVRNTGDCPTDVTLQVTAPEVNEEDTVSLDAGESDTIEVSASTTGSAGEDIEFTADVVSQGDTVGAEQFTMTVGQPDIGVNSVNIPSGNLCLSTNDDNTLLGSVTVSNANECGGDVRGSVTGDLESDITIEETNVSGRDEVELEFDIPLEDGLTEWEYTLELEADNGGWEEIESSTEQLARYDLDISITEVDYPDVGMVGEVDGSALVKNDGECDVEITFNGVSDSTTTVIDSGSEVEFAETIDLTTDGVDTTVSVVDVYTGNDLGSENVVIEPERYADIDTQSGTIEVVGSDSTDVFFDANIAGSGIESDQEIEDESVVLGFSNVGKISSASLSLDPILVEYDALQVFDARSNKSLTWIVDGEIEDKSNSFRYSTVVGESMLNVGNAVEELDAQTTVLVGPGINIGTFRRKFGLKRMLSILPLMEMRDRIEQE